MKIGLVNSQFMNWEFFDCGLPELTQKLIQEASLAETGFQKLYGAFLDETQTDLAGVMTVRAGQLQAPLEDVARVAGRTGVTVPTLHVEVLAVRLDCQRQGVGEELVWYLLDIAHEMRQEVGLYTVSLEATENSVPFYQALGFEASEVIYDDGTRAMWLVL